MVERRTARPMCAGGDRAVSVPGSDPDDLQRRVYASSANKTAAARRVPDQGAGRYRCEKARRQPSPISRGNGRSGRVLHCYQRSLRQTVLQGQPGRNVRAGGLRRAWNPVGRVRLRRPDAYRPVKHEQSSRIESTGAGTGIGILRCGVYRQSLQWRGRKSCWCRRARQPLDGLESGAARPGLAGQPRSAHDRSRGVSSRAIHQPSIPPGPDQRLDHQQCEYRRSLRLPAAVLLCRRPTSPKAWSARS